MRAPTWSAAVALLAVGALAGVVGARWFRAMEPLSTVAHAREDTNGETAAALLELRRSIDALPAALRAEIRADPTLASERRPADASIESDVARLARAVERLEAVLAVGARRDSAYPDGAARSPAHSRSWKGPGFESLEAMCVRVQELQRAEGDEWWQRGYDELARAHLLWTRDDLLEHYGAPHRIDPSSGIGLVYEEPRFLIGKETCGFKFMTTEGIVTAVDFECR